VRQPVAALVGVLLWFFMAENLLGLVAGPLAGFLPGKLAVALSVGAVSGTLAAAALVAYALAMITAGAFEIRRRDLL
jgi:hypothetical protein